jgi:hypothetical protein
MIFKKWLLADSYTTRHSIFIGALVVRRLFLRLVEFSGWGGETGGVLEILDLRVGSASLCSCNRSNTNAKSSPLKELN